MMYVLRVSSSDALYGAYNIHSVYKFRDVYLLSGKPSKDALRNVLLDVLKKNYSGESVFELKFEGSVYRDSFKSEVVIDCKVGSVSHVLVFSLHKANVIDI